MSTAITLPADYGYVILALAAIAFHYQFASRYIPGLRKELKIEYPDMGCGIYAKKLSDKDWVRFGNAQRVHQNYLEQLPNTLLFTAFSGLFQPKVTAGLAVSYIIGREIYTQGYFKSGPRSRLYGAPFIYTGYLGMFGIMVWGAAKSVGLF
ncbi:hypothetical protein H9P43_006499 [Blastocladiella emersonii ATCC 22665]|nr:hypothetical protein H9P43_006499 [Blastocladiella emersonii ATCC 22665]